MPSASGDSKKAMDITTTDATPSETSRPVIVSNRKIVKDPMMKPEESEAKSDDIQQAGPTKQTLASTGKTLQPLSTSSNDKPVTPEPETDTSQPDSSPASTEDDAAEKQAKEEAAIVDAVANQARNNKKDDKIETDTTKQAAIQKLIDDKTYFLPIGEITKRKQNKQVFAVAGFIILALAGTYAALDLELIKSPVDLPFRIFNGR